MDTARMEFDKLAQTSATTTIRCTIGSEPKQFTIADAEDISAGIQLLLTETTTGRMWTLTQQENSTYHLSAEDDEQTYVLTESDVVIQ